MLNNEYHQYHLCEANRDMTAMKNLYFLTNQKAKDYHFLDLKKSEALACESQIDQFLTN